MRRWLRFFLGSPRRALVTFTVVIILGAIQHFAPGAIQNVATNLVAELSPLLKMVFTWGLAFFLLYLGFKVMLKPFFPKRGKR